MSSMIESFDSLARLLLEALLNTLWQGMLIAALVWLLLRFIKRLSATTRHAVWLVTLLTIGALPFVAVVVNRNLSIPKLTAPVKPEPEPAVQTTPVSPAAEIGQPTDPFSLNNEIARLDAAANRGKIGYEFGAPPRFSEQKFDGVEQKFDGVEQKFDGVAGTLAFKDVSVAGAATAVTPPLKPENKPLWLRARSLFANVFSGPAPALLIGLWLIMCALMAWRMASSYRAVFRLRGRLEPTPPEQHRRVERLAARFGIKRRVRAFTSDEIVMPMTVGSLKPLIILPPDLAGDLSQAEFESVVAHELAHIKRWDYLTNLLQRVAQAYLFFHPAVWFICKQLMIERELACDDWAVKTCEPRRYASCLTKLVEALNESKPHMAMRVAATGIGGIIFGKHVISRRVEMILNRDRNATTAVSKPALLYAIGLVVMFVAVCSLISPVIAVPLGQKPPKQSKKESKPVAPARSQEIPAPQPATTAPPAAAPLVEAPDALDIPDTPEPPDAPSPAAAALAPDAPFTPFPGVVVQPAPAIPGLFGQGMGVGQGMGIGLGQGAQATTITPAPGSPLSVITVGQENRQPVIPENELIGLLVDVVKRDADLNVRNEALQGLCRLRSDAAINALIQLYDSSADAKVKGEIIPYLMRREARDSKVDNSKAIAKLTAIAKSEQNEDLRRRAIRQLANVKGDEGADTLIQIYDTLQDPRMKQSVISSLASNRSRKAIDKLIQIAKNDSDPNVRRYAIQSLYNVDSRQYLELIDRDRPRIGRVDGQFFTPMPNVMAFPTPRVFEHNLDTKAWEEWQREWRKNWEEQSERFREMIEKMRIDGVEKLRIEDLQNRLRIEMPRIEIQLKDLENKIRLGYGQDCAAAAESQLRTQLAAVEAQLTTLRARYTDADPKTSEMRNLRNALERQLNSVRSMRSPGLRRAPAPGRSVTSSASTSATPSAAPKAKTASTVNTTAISF